MENLQTPAQTPSDAIVWFEDEYAFLSNFHPSPFMVEWDMNFQSRETGEYIYGYRQTGHVQYDTVEHWFAACKAATWNDHEVVRLSPTPGEAKRTGRCIPLRSDWETIKYDVMAVGLRLKFALGSELARLLLDTGDRVLIEGNTWHDEVWGCTWQVEEFGSGWRGENHLGRLLMERRNQLRSDA